MSFLFKCCRYEYNYSLKYRAHKMYVPLFQNLVYVFCIDISYRLRLFTKLNSVLLGKSYIIM